jgi:DNA-binding GntR family transcriptional regulator
VVHVSSAAWDEREDAAFGVRPVAASSGRRLAPVIYDLLKERLLEGVFAAGERLQVEALKTEFGVSKQPVMEAMRTLAADGLVEIIPQVGCRVPIYSPTDVADFFAIFAGTEGAVAGVAARRYTDAQLGELVDVNAQIDRLESLPEAVDRAHGYRMLNRRFHGLVHAMAHSPVVAEISRRMWDMSDLLINTSGARNPLAGALHERHDDHERIITALRERDGNAARYEMEQHIVGTVGVIHLEQARASPGG